MIGHKELNQTKKIWLFKHIIEFCRHPTSFEFLKFKISEILNFHPWRWHDLYTRFFQRSHYRAISSSLHQWDDCETTKRVWSGNTAVTNCRQICNTTRKSHTIITRHQEDKQSKATSSLSNAQLNIEQLQNPTMEVTINNDFNNNRTTALERTAAWATGRLKCILL